MRSFQEQTNESNRRESRKAFDECLRQSYNATLVAPLPPRLQDLIRRLDESQMVESIEALEKAAR